MLRALEHEDWNQSRAARRLGVHRNTLIARLAAWGISTRDRTMTSRQLALGGQMGVSEPFPGGDGVL